MARKQSSSTLRSLLFGNLLVYLVAGALMAYFFIFPAPDATDDPAAFAGNVPGGGPFLNLMLPTPTPFARVSKNFFPSPTADAPSSNSNLLLNLTPTLSSQAVGDNALVPPTALNILLLGTDRRNPTDASWRTDTIILLSVNQQAKSVGLLSIPRDLWVKIPGYGYDRINTADFYGDYYKYPGGGEQLIKDTVEQNLGIRVHYYARIDFNVFRQGIDTLGGVDVNVDCPLVEYGFSDDLGTVNLNFQPGLQHMDGATALRYARSRETTNDFDRSRRQRQVILAAWDKVTQLNLISKWPDLYSQFRASVKTDLGPTELAALAWIGSQLRPDHIKSRAIDNRYVSAWVTPGGADVELPNAQKIHSLLVDFFALPDAQQVQASDEKATVEVLSGTGVQQTADLAAVSLKQQGFDIVSSNVASSRVNATTLFVYSNSKPQTIARLQQVLNIAPANVRVVNDPNPRVDLQIVLGRDYNACSAGK